MNATVVSASGDETVRPWDDSIKAFIEHTNGVNSVAVSRDGRKREKACG